MSFSSVTASIGIFCWPFVNFYHRKHLLYSCYKNYLAISYADMLHWYAMLINAVCVRGWCSIHDTGHCWWNSWIGTTAARAAMQRRLSQQNRWQMVSKKFQNPCLRFCLKIIFLWSHIAVTSSLMQACSQLLGIFSILIYFVSFILSSPAYLPYAASKEWFWLICCLTGWLFNSLPEMLAAIVCKLQPIIICLFLFLCNISFTTRH